MDMNDYQTAANEFCSPSFFGDGVDMFQLSLALGEAALHCEKLDKYKRSLFYDDRTKYALQQNDGIVLESQSEIDTLHALLGVITEAGELAEGYVTTGDKVNLMEEAGDLLWYIALLCKGLGVNMSSVGERNIQKLSARYKDKVFTTEQALNRDLVAERAILEG
jgi:NTP pyrophosphatase (non-canonical NTP hydrolase)